METKNLMAVVPQAAPNVSGKKSTLAADKDANQDSFGEALEKIDKDVQNAITKAVVDNSQESAADNGDVMDEAPKDPLAAVIAASQQLAAITPEQGELAMPQSDMPVVELDFSEEAQAELVAPVQKQAPKAVELQSLIPQSEEEGLKNRDFLAMLSGQQLKSKPAPQGGADNAGNAPVQPMQPTTNLEAQLLSVKQGGQQPLNLPNQASVLENLTGQPNLQEAAAENLAVGDLRAPQQVLAVSQLATAEKDSQPISKLLPDVTVSVENEAVPAPIHMDAKQAMMQQGEQNPQNQQGKQQEAVEINVANSGKMVQQLAEEAVGDKPQAQTAANGNTQTVSPFQQQLQETLTGTAAPADVQKVQQPQADFDIPRQIVDQARLIRRAADTQMVIKLNPEHLGELTLKVSVTQNGSVNASFHSDNAQVRAVIENSLVQLRQELNNQGLKVDSVEVYAGLADGQLPQDQGQQAWQNQQGNHSGNVRILSMDAEDYADEADNLSAAAIQGAAANATDGVDYRI
ncbi:flagellar hook-length control protein FliK [Selenomonas sp. WCT3]|uniref:flagellar hook-length control protein FliK n=1 Tax=Selenomonas sp. WCT3 TaxID=3158785 RepID=UPI00088FC4FD|nr:flagellar hook-length control protein FliK [Selenomonas ruminantium]